MHWCAMPGTSYQEAWRFKWTLNSRGRINDLDPKVVLQYFENGLLEFWLPFFCYQQLSTSSDVDVLLLVLNVNTGKFCL